MLRNQLILALRHFWRNKGFLFINVMGLAIGIAAFLFIVAYVNFEFSYDDFHQRGDRLYRVSVDFYKNGIFELSDAECYNLAGETMRQEFEEIEDFTNIRGFFTFSMRYQDKIFQEDKVLYADANFLKLFSFTVIQGDKHHALQDPYSLILTRTAASKIFGEADALGKSVVLNGKHTVTITAVIEDIPANSHIHFDHLLSYSTALAINPASNFAPNWNGNNGFTYVLLREDATAHAVQKKLTGFSKRHLVNRDERLIIQPVKDIHLHSNKTFEIEPNKNAGAVQLLLGIGFLILAIAWINYINLSTSRSVERAKEVGIRKTLGSQRAGLIKQFMLESFLVNLLAVLFAVVIVESGYPIVTGIIGAEMLLWKFQTGLWSAGVVFFLAGTVLSGFYPAWVLSSYKPISILKGRFYSSARGIFLRKALVVTQFMASFILVCGTITIQQQLQFMQKKDLGMNLDQVLVLHAPKDIADTARQAGVHSFMHRAQSLSFVQGMGISETLPGHGTSELNSNSGSINRYSPDERQAPTYYNFNVNETFFSTLEIGFLAGRDFSGGAGANRDKIIINEEALKKLEFNSPEEAIGEKIYWGTYRPEIIGVIKDYNHLSLDNDQIPLIFFYTNYAGYYYTLRLRPFPGELHQSIEHLRMIWKETFGDSVFEYFFLDDRFNAQYESDRQFSQLFTAFAVLAVILACLGLSGLSAYAVVQRTKEIGVRKVLGASIPQIIQILSADFIKLIFVAIIISTVCASWAINAWLNSYAFRIELSWWMFVMPAIILLATAMMTMGYHTVRASLSNPVDSLRAE